MKKSELKKATQILYAILVDKKYPKIPHLTKKGTISSLKKIFRKIKNIPDYLKNTKKKHEKEEEYIIEEKNRKLNKNLLFYKKKNYTYSAFHNVFNVQGHVAFVSCVLLLEDVLITAAEDKIIKIWDVKEGFLIRSLIKHNHVITDLCVSMDTKFLVSCDVGGFLIIWNLINFEILYILEFHGEIELVEFIFKNEKILLEDCINKDIEINNQEKLLNENKKILNNNTLHKLVKSVDINDIKLLNSSNDNHLLSIENGNNSSYTLIAVMSKGNVFSITFDKKTILNTSENTIMSTLGEAETIRAICISEGGRFLLSGGLWPFLLVFDTHNLNNAIFTLETDGHSINSVVASKNKVLFVASTNFNFIYEWEFICNRLNKNVLYKNKEGLGYWTRRIIYIHENENIFCERVEYLSDNSILCYCSDGKLIIAGNEEDFLEVKDVGIICAHHDSPLFAISGIFEDFSVIKKRFKKYNMMNKNHKNESDKLNLKKYDIMNKNHKNESDDLNFKKYDIINKNHRNESDDLNFKKYNFLNQINLDKNTDKINQINNFDFNDLKSLEKENKNLIKELFSNKKIKKIKTNFIKDDEKESFTNNRHQLRFYTRDLQLLSSYDLIYKATDSNFNFSSDTFTFADEFGQIHIFNINPFTKKYDNKPKEQFFKSELNVIYGYDQTIENFEETFDQRGNKNENWRLKKIDFSKNREKHLNFYRELEFLAMNLIIDKFFSFDKFFEKYIVPESNIYKTQEESKEISSSNDEISFVSSFSSEEIDKKSIDHDERKKEKTS